MKIAIVKLSAMGDIIHAMVALEFIKKARPMIRIDWIVEEAFAPLLEHNPHIDTILPVNLKAIKKDKTALFREIRKVKSYAKNNYDLIIDAQGLLKSALVARVLGKNIAGYSKDSIREGIASYFYTQKVAIGYEQNAITRNIKVICEPLGIVVDEDEILNKKPFLYFDTTAPLSRVPDRFIVFVVGASVVNKIYPKEKFLQIAQALENEEIVVVWANEREYKIGEFLAKEAKNVHLLDKLNLDALKHLLSKAQLVIGGDTGPTHMAWGLNVPSITIFGNTPQYRNTFITPINRVVKSHTQVNALKLDKSDFSIQEIDPQEVIELVKELLK